MVVRDDDFLDDEYRDNRPAKGRKSGRKQPDLRHESQEDFGLTRRSRSYAQDEDEGFLEDFDEDDLVDDDDLDLDDDDEADFDDDDDDLVDFEDDEDF